MTFYMTQLLSSSDLSYMRSVEATAMPNNGEILKPVLSSTPLGNQEVTWSSYGTVACDVWPITRNVNEFYTGGIDIAEGMFYISVPYNTEITVEDIILIDSLYYQVTFVPKNVSWLTNLRIEAKNYNAS